MPACLERLKFYLTEAGVPYTVQPHRTAYTAQTVAAEVHEKGEHVAKVVIVKAGQKLVMLVLPAPARVDLERVKQALDVTYAALAREDEFKHVFPDCDLGAMPPFGNLYKLPVYLDRHLAQQPELVLQAGTHQVTMRIPMADYRRLAQPEVGDFILEPAELTPAG